MRERWDEYSKCWLADVTLTADELRAIAACLPTLDKAVAEERSPEFRRMADWLDVMNTQGGARQGAEC
jgi:hypothetical protein